MYECECCGRMNVPAKLKGCGYICEDCFPSYWCDDHTNGDHNKHCPFKVDA